MTNVTPPQAIPVIALMMALGLTVMVTEKGVPLHPPALGVTLYEAFLSVLTPEFRVNVAENKVGLPELEIFPDRKPPPLGGGHVYVVLVGIILPSVGCTGVNDTFSPEQITRVKLLTEGVGLIGTVKANVLPIQVPNAGVTV
jgi:hypothetical protein